MTLRAVGAVLGMSVLSLAGLCQTFINLNYAAGFGDCDIDMNQDGVADGWAVWHAWGSQPPREVGVIPSISTSQRFSGFGSQQIVFNRTSGSAGRIGFVYTIMNNNQDRRPVILPPEGAPLLFRVRIQTQDLQGVTPRLSIGMGDRPIVVASSIPNNTGGWQTFSTIVPLQRASNGDLLVYLAVEFDLQAGAVSGRAWIDAVECLWTQFPAPQRVRPNPLQIAHYIAHVSHWTSFLSPPPDFVTMSLDTVLALQAHLPNIAAGQYFAAASTTSSSPTTFDLYGGYEWVLQNHPSWFLRDSTGQPLRNPAYPYLYLIDIGLPEVRQRAINRLQTISQTFPLPEWIFLDEVGGWWPCVQYPTMDSVFPAWTGYLQTVCPYVRNGLRRKVMINLGSWAGNFVDNNPGVQWLSLVDAVMLEHVVVLYSRTAPNYRYQPYRYASRNLYRTDHSWWATLRAVTENPNTKWLLVIMWNGTDTAMLRYILASYFIFQHANTYLMIEDRGRHSGGDTYQLWVSRPEVWVPLGRATGSWRVVAGTVADTSGALFARDYEHGIVLVNPTENQTYSYRVPRTYKNWDGAVVTEGTVLQIGPKTGVVLYAAPEITLTITPQNITALPGETVTLTVQYRNQGLSDATNVTITVPLPEGMVFVSSSSGGQYQNGRVTWTLPLVRAGASGTLTFQARVQ